MNTDDRALADLIERMIDLITERDIRLAYEHFQHYAPSPCSASALRSAFLLLLGGMPDRLRAFHAKPVVGEECDYVMVRRDVISFLRGEGELDGQYYGDGTPPGEYRFWWRKYLAALQSPPPVVSGEVTGETLEQYSDRIVAKTRKIMMDRLPDDVIGDIRDSHLVFGKACAQIAVTTAMDEMAGAIAAEKAATPKSVPAVEEGRRDV